MDFSALGPLIAFGIGFLLFFLTLRILSRLLQTQASADADDVAPSQPFRFLVRELDEADDGRVLAFGLLEDGRVYNGNRAVIVRADGLQIDTRVLAVGIERGWTRLLLDDVKRDELSPGDFIYNADQFV